MSIFLTLIGIRDLARCQIAVIFSISPKTLGYALEEASTIFDNEPFLSF